MPRTAPWLVLLAAALPACGGKSFKSGTADDSGDSDGSAQAGTGTGSGGGTATGGTGSSGGNFAGSATGGLATAGSGGALQCDPSGLKDDTSNGVEVRLINGTQHPIYLGNTMPGCDVPLVQVTSASGQPWSEGGGCTTTCQQLMSGNVNGCSPILCPVASVVTLAPAESTVISWLGLSTQRVVVPPACLSKSLGTECQRIARAEPGTYVFSAQAGSAMMCNSPDLASCQSCEPSGDGGCRTSAATISGPLLHAQTQLYVDASYGLGEPVADGLTRQVEVTFTD